MVFSDHKHDIKQNIKRFDSLLRNFFIAKNLFDGFCWYFPTLIWTFGIWCMLSFNDIKRISSVICTTSPSTFCCWWKAFNIASTDIVTKNIHISLKLSLHYVECVHIKIRKYQQKPSISSEAMKNLRSRESNRFIFRYMSCLWSKNTTF